MTGPQSSPEHHKRAELSKQPYSIRTNTSRARESLAMEGPARLTARYPYTSTDHFLEISGTGLLSTGFLRHVGQPPDQLSAGNHKITPNTVRRCFRNDIPSAESRCWYSYQYPSFLPSMMSQSLCLYQHSGTGTMSLA